MHAADAFRARIRAGGVCVGTGISFSDPAVAELCADAGFDFVWIDMEHGPIGIETALTHIMVLRGTGTAAFVRVPQNELNILKRVLDLAPDAVIVPQVQTAEEAVSAVRACKYPPAGVRGFGPRRAVGYGAVPAAEYIAGANERIMVFIQIEHIQAVRNLDAILATPGLDGICLGPMDLSGSMGKLGQVTDPEVVAAIDAVVEKARPTGLFIGAAVGFSPESLAVWLRRGVHWINLSNDWRSLFEGSRRIVEAVRGAAPALTRPRTPAT